MIEDVVPESAWQELSLTGERYLPWSGGWLQKSGLQLAINGFLFPFGMQLLEIYRDYDYADAVGFDVVGTGAYPLPPILWNNDEMVGSMANMRKLLTPRVTD